MKNQLLLIIFLFLGTSMSAQGLSGKRFVVFYNADYNGLSWTAFGQINRDDTVGYYNFKDDEEKSILKSVVSFRHSFGLNYIVNRRVSAGLQVGLFKDSYGAGGEEGDIFLVPFTSNFKYFSTEAEIKIFKIANKGAIAPLGAYTAWKLGVSRIKTNVKITELLLLDSEEIPTIDRDFNALSLAVVFGNQFLLYKKVMMNIGFEFKYNIIMKDEDDRLSLNITSETVKSQVLWGDLFRMRVGIGFASF